MRQHERALQLREPCVVDARAGKEAESRVDAVDSPARGDDVIDSKRRRIDRRLGGDIDTQRDRLRPEAAQIREPQVGGNEIEVRLLSIKNFPPRFSLWNMGALIGDLYQGPLQYPCPFLITLGVHILEPEATNM